MTNNNNNIAINGLTFNDETLIKVKEITTKISLINSEISAGFKEKKSEEMDPFFWYESDDEDIETRHKKREEFWQQKFYKLRQELIIWENKLKEIYISEEMKKFFETSKDGKRQLRIRTSILKNIELRTKKTDVKNLVIMACFSDFTLINNKDNFKKYMSI
uniref:Uncharacterized protein n=1 Tax=Hypsizygus marmoreus TaxID=39966 RepID=A0A4P8D2R1_HYPMA|nr:hypothetical protein [Hypsizygus marmoreus]